jgi:hypothetical protein
VDEPVPHTHDRVPWDMGYRVSQDVSLRTSSRLLPPRTSIARTTAKSSIRSESRSARLRPAMKLQAASAASIMCAIRTRSSARILDTRGA